MGDADKMADPEDSKKTPLAPENVTTTAVETPMVGPTGRWKILFFAAAISVMTGAIVGIICGVERMIPPLDLITQGYVLFFGFILAAVDFPIAIPHLNSVQKSTYKYMLFLTRFTGRGLCYLFLACTLIINLWTLRVQTTAGVWLGLYVGILGVVATHTGYSQSLRLERLRQKLLEQAPSQLNAVCPAEGMSSEYFNELASRLIQSRFTTEETVYIFAALRRSIHPPRPELLMQHEFIAWLKSNSMAVM